MVVSITCSKRTDTMVKLCEVFESLKLKIITANITAVSGRLLKTVFIEVSPFKFTSLMPFALCSIPACLVSNYFVIVPLFTKPYDIVLILLSIPTIQTLYTVNIIILSIFIYSSLLPFPCLTITSLYIYIKATKGNFLVRCANITAKTYSV